MNLKRKIKNIINRDNGKLNDVGRTNEKNRQIWLEKTLKRIPEGGKILDAGAGEQQYKRLCEHLNYVSQDFAQYQPSQIETGIQKEEWDYGKLDIVSDIASIPCPDDHFDAVMCVEVIEHVVNPKEAISEFSRLLKTGGHLILTAPFCSLTHFAPYHFYSGFNQFFYETTLKDNGFDILEIVPNGNYFEYLAQEIRRLPKVAKDYCNSNLTSNEYKTLHKTMKLLKNLSDSDTSSSELLCYGYHVLAKKI